MRDIDPGMEHHVRDERVMDVAREFARNGDLSVTQLAHRSNTSDVLIRALEAAGNEPGATCSDTETQRLADLLGVTLEDLGIGRL
jgi:hypothetical protein